MVDENPEQHASAPSVGDSMAAWAKTGASSVTFERIGGGEGPGWNGRVYEGVESQIGGPFEFKGSSLSEILNAAREALGGGTYRWRVRASDGKWHTDTIVFPGEPKPLPGVNDPAAERQRQAAQFWQGAPGAAPGFGPAPGYPGAYVPASRKLPAGFFWSPGTNSWMFVNESGELDEPPPGVAPPRAPFGGGLGAFGYPNAAAAFPYAGEDPEKKALREELREQRNLVMTLLTKKDGNGTEGMAAMMLQAIQASITNTQNMAAADRAAASQRAADDRAAAIERDKRAAELRAVETKLMDKLMEKAGAGGAPAKSAIEKALEERMVNSILDGETIGGKKDKDDDLTHGERMGEKIVDGLSQLVEFGKTWLEKDDKPAKNGGPSPAPSAPSQPAANGAAAANDGLDDDTRRWLTMLDVVTEAYANGRSPAQGFEMLYASAKGSGVNFDKVLSVLHTFTADKIITWIGSQAAAKDRAAPIVAAFQTGDGKAWFDKLIAHARTVPLESKAGG